MNTYNFGDLAGNNQPLSTKAKRIILITAPVIGAIIDYLITGLINGDSLFASFNFTFFVYIGFAVWLFVGYKKIRNWGKNKEINEYKNGIKQVLQSSSKFYKEKDSVIVGPQVKLEENETDLYLTFRMPYGVSKENFKNNKDLFENAIGYSVMKINENQHDLTFHFQKAEKEISTDYLYDYKNYITLGFDSYGQPIDWEPVKEPHLIVAASTGGGKTVYLQSIVLQLKHLTDDLTFVDFKGNEFGPLEQEGYKVHTDLDGVLDTLRAFNLGMKDRARQLKEQRLRDYTELNLQPAFLVFDEYSELISMFPNTKEGKAEKQEFESLLGSICRLGRSAGYFVILSMQQPNANTLSTEIRDNMGKKVAIRGGTPTIQTMIFGERVNEIDTNLNHGNHIMNTGAGYEVINVPYYQGDFFSDMAKA